MKGKLDDSNFFLYAAHHYSNPCVDQQEFLDDLNRIKNLQVTILRFFNTIGPFQVGNYGMVVPRFINMALNNEPITIYGDGNQTRDFLRVEELCNIINKLLNEIHITN